MLAHETAHRRAVQDVIEPAVRRREPIEPMAQRPPEPGTDGYGKPQLGVIEDRGRHQPADRTAEDLFPHAVADLQSRRQRERELDERMVEQRHARLERYRHAHPVHLGQDVAGEVGGDVDQRHLRHEVAGVSGGERVRQEVAELTVSGHEAVGGHPAVDGCKRERDGAGVCGFPGPRAIEQAAPAGRDVR